MYKRQYLIPFLILISQLIFSQKGVKIDYSLSAREYEIAGIEVEGAESYDKSVIISFSELSVGDKIKVPGNDITKVVKRFWKQGMFSDVKIIADKIEDGKIWLKISLKQQPKISEIKYSGAKKSHIEDFENSIGLTKGGQFTKNLESQAKNAILEFYADKGYHNAEVTITPETDISMTNGVIVHIDIDRKTKVKVHKITYKGNENISSAKLNKAMKKTNEKGKILNLFKSKKYVESLYEADKIALIERYNEDGYRDAKIVFDTVKVVEDYDIKKRKNKNAEPGAPKYIYDTVKVEKNTKLVDVYIEIDEGKKYYFGDIKWVGNTMYPSGMLSDLLRIKKGDVYNSILLNERLIVDEDAVANLYQDNGYLFSNIDPVEVRVNGDSIDLEMRIYEGKQATINKIGITGNTRVYDHVVRRELRTKPGQLYNKSDIMRTLREIAQMGHFDPESMVPDISPNPENGTVDIEYQLQTKSSDQIELSAGYGATGVTGSLGLKFTNFAIQNIFKPETYKIVPQGEGQTLSLKATTNGSYYSSVSASFLDPWFGKKRPNSLSLSAFYSRQSGISDRYTDTYSSYYSSYYSSTYGTSYAYEVDPDKYIHIFGTSLGWGTRLQWPDDYFTFNAALSYRKYSLKNWSYFIMSDGVSNDLSLGLTLSRNSIDNPIFTRQGSSFGFSAESTLPYSLLSDRTYDENSSDAERYEWLEYYKLKFKSKVFTPLTEDKKLVLMTRAEYGFLGYYNKYRKSPFGTFYLGGDGMSGTSTSYSTEVIALRGYSNGALTPYDSDNGGYDGNVYTRLSLELRYPLLLEGSTNIYVLGFADAGNCWSEFSEFNPFDLKRAAGVGIRLFLPMFGLMGVDWGYGFDDIYISGTKYSSYSGSHFTFVLGQEF